MITTLFMLLYGDYPQLHRKVLQPLLKQPVDQVDIRLWLNTVRPETFKWLLVHAPKTWTIYVSDQNVPKYRVMRLLFNDAAYPIKTPWVTWFDDDTEVVAADWLAKTLAFTRNKPTITLFGLVYFKLHLPGIPEWIKAAKWYHSRAFQRHHRRKGTGIHFVQGSYWWLTTAAMRKLDWPDRRLNHNGGDTALSEAIWQAGLPQAAFAYGVNADCMDRRGYTESPAGLAANIPHPSDNSHPSMVSAMARYHAMMAAKGIKFAQADASLAVISPTPTVASSATGIATLAMKITKAPLRKHPNAVKPVLKFIPRVAPKPILPKSAQRIIRPIVKRIRPRMTLKQLLDRHRK